MFGSATQVPDGRTASQELTRMGFLHAHPPELTLLRGEHHASALLKRAGLSLADYTFNAGDGFVQAVVVAQA